MMKGQKVMGKQWVLPIVVIVVSLYLIGTNMINRIDKVDDPKIYAAQITGMDIHEDKDLQTTPNDASESKDAEDIININVATKEELLTLDGIGAIIADRIIDMRNKLGGFESIDDLLLVEGIGEGRIEKIKNKIVVK